MHYVFKDFDRGIKRTLWADDPQEIIDWYRQGVDLGQRWHYLGAVYPSTGDEPVIADQDPVNQWLDQYEGRDS